jgi:hypothetical protein
MTHPDQYQDSFAVPAGAGRTRAIRAFLAEMPLAARADILDCRPKAKRLRRNRTFAPRGPNRFRQNDVARALRAAKAAGGGRVDVDPISGKISITLTNADEPPAPFDEWLAKRKTNARQT